MLTWEELIGISSTTGYDIWNEDNPKIPNYSTPKYGARHFKPHLDDSMPTYRGRHLKPQDIETSDPSKISHITRGETLQTPTFRNR